MTDKGAICPTCKKPIPMPGACFLCNLARNSLTERTKCASKPQKTWVK